MSFFTVSFTLTCFIASNLPLCLAITVLVLFSCFGSVLSYVLSSSLLAEDLRVSIETSTLLGVNLGFLCVDLSALASLVASTLPRC